MTIRFLSKALMASALIMGVGVSGYAKDIPATYAKTCAVCHDAGSLNAPKKGDKAAWSKLKSQKGMAALVKATREGMPQMPAKGLCNDCSNADFQTLIEYMAQ